MYIVLMYLAQLKRVFVFSYFLEFMFTLEKISLELCSL